MVSCGNNGSNSNSSSNSSESPQYTYRLVVQESKEWGDDIFLDGLLLGVPRENGNGYDYIAFDDEMNYNAYASEFLIAYEAAKRCWNLIEDETEREKLGRTFEDIEKALSNISKGNLPITNEVSNEKLKEAINSAYYDYRNEIIYEPEEGYGYREYPWGNGGSRSLEIGRKQKYDYKFSKSTTIDGESIPPDALVIPIYGSSLITL